MVNIRFCEDPAEPGKVIRVNTCKCGQVFTILNWFEEECPKCGRLYNGAGQELAPRSQWGEETGESPADIYNPRYRDPLDEMEDLENLKYGRGV